MSRTHIIQNTIPTRYDPRVTVMPCEPARVPRLPVEILYQIAKALPQPKQVYHLALASKETWEYLQPALYECEVTFEARLAHTFEGESSTTLEQFSDDYSLDTFSDFASSEEDGSWGGYESDIQNDSAQHGSDWQDDLQSDGDQHGNDWENDVQGENDFQSDDYDYSEDDSATEASGSHRERTSRCQGASIFGYCDGRIDIEKRIFKASKPEGDDPIRIDGAMSALHWAAKQGASGLSVAQKAIRAALAHQPSYINGVKLQERYIPDPKNDYTLFPRCIPVDLPPPLFLAVAHGNFEVFKALLDAGSAVNLLQGQSVCGYRSQWARGTLTSFKIHEECMEGRFDPCMCECRHEYWRGDLVEEEPRICQLVGHIAVRYDQPEMLKVLLQSGLNIQPPQPRSLHLAQFAVRRASLAALEVLLDHDPSLVHSRLQHGTLLHSVRFIGQNAERDVRDGLMRSTISCLLDHGAVLNARAHDEVDRSDGESETDDGLTALQAALLFPLETVRADPKLFTSLHAAEVLVSMGANWNQGLPVARHTPSHILYRCFKKAVVITSSTMLAGKERAQCVEIRVAWGRVFKTIVETAQESLTRDSSQRRNALRLFSLLFAELVKFWTESSEHSWSICPLAAKGIGELLLSTGITPSDAYMQKWSMLCSGEDIRG
ncbi:hypothetical protein LA080_007042 [Diaporthe eres]|nr:hypothetical protein LA080_007042 [Diaporthe eres]